MEKQVILVLRSIVTSTRDIYTNEWMRQSRIQVQELSKLSEDNKIGSRGTAESKKVK